MHGIATKIEGNFIPISPIRINARSRKKSIGAWIAIITITLAVGAGIYKVGPWELDKAPPASQIDIPESSPAPAGDIAGPADLAVGTYHGDMIADSKNASRSDVVLSINKLDKWTVRVTSDYSRIRNADVILSRYGEKIIGDPLFLLNLDQNPPTLEYGGPDGDFAYRGTRLE